LESGQSLDHGALPQIRENNFLVLMATTPLNTSEMSLNRFCKDLKKSRFDVVLETFVQQK
jgi:hypothetical protein